MSRLRRTCSAIMVLAPMFNSKITFSWPHRQTQRLKLIVQLLPLMIIAVVAVIGATRLDKVQEYLAEASGEPANLIIDAEANFGPLPQPWQNLGQGGEMHDWTLSPIKGKVAALQPAYIRLDHIYSFYDIVQQNGDQLTFDFSKLDPLITEILETGAKPYLSLSYMPAVISEDGTITGKPRNWEDWQATIRATVQHYSKDRGISNVIYEVWNEPDLFGDWKTYGDKNYLELYAYAARGAAQVQGARPYQFGGPATTALYRNWFDTLVEFTQENNLRLDFYSWHRYDDNVEQFRRDFSDLMTWQSQAPGAENLEFHLTEYGHESDNDAGYDSNYSAAHTVAVATEMPAIIYRGVAFEIEDGPDPAGQTYWGRWGLLTHRDTGNQVKPRYSAMRLLNRLSGDQLKVLGKGTWVKALATKNADTIELIVVNYDRFGRHTEEVPINFRNIEPGSYTLEITELNGNSRQINLSTDIADLAITHYMGANTVNLLRLIPAD